MKYLSRCITVAGSLSLEKSCIWQTLLLNIPCYMCGQRTCPHSRIEKNEECQCAVSPCFVPTVKPCSRGVVNRRSAPYISSNLAFQIRTLAVRRLPQTAWLKIIHRNHSMYRRERSVHQRERGTDEGITTEQTAAAQYLKQTNVKHKVG